MSPQGLDRLWKEAVWGQLGGAIGSLEAAIDACSAEVWGEKVGPHEFWYLAYHTLFWLDYYLNEPGEAFAPPEPFTLAEMDPAGVYPDRVYSKDELKKYLEHGRAKAHAVLAAMTDERARRVRKMYWGEITEAELLLQSVRHVQHHTGQLQLLLRQGGVPPGRWVRRATSPL